MQYEYRQFKLVNGEEIVCEIIQWQNEEELELVIRKPMRLVTGESQGGVKYYAFRPWMVYQENPDEFVILNGHHVVGICEPNQILMKQYQEAIEDMRKIHEERFEEFVQENPNTQKESLTDRMKKLLEEVNEASDSDSDGKSNILMFDPSKRTLH